MVTSPFAVQRIHKIFMERSIEIMLRGFKKSVSKDECKHDDSVLFIAGLKIKFNDKIWSGCADIEYYTNNTKLQKRKFILST